MSKKVHYLWLIVIASILITILANIGFIGFFYELSQIQGLSEERQAEFALKLNLRYKTAFSELLLLLIIVFFNFSWKDYLISKNLNRVKRIFFIIISNILIFVFLMYFDFILEKYLDPNLKFVKFYLFNYFLKHLPVIVIAYILPYLLLRMYTMKLTELHLARIKEEKSKAELSALKEQISPHFFFNTLSTLSTIVRNETREDGLEFIQDMSNTYRYTLTSANKDLVILRKEVDFITSYVYLLQRRFGEKLQFEIHIPDEYLNIPIPPMSLQLLVENAIQHNVITQKSPLKIIIYIENNMIWVTNNLQEKEYVDSFGIGLKNLTNRYKLLTKNEIIIERTSSKFIVKLPLS